VTSGDAPDIEAGAHHRGVGCTVGLGLEPRTATAPPGELLQLTAVPLLDDMGELVCDEPLPIDTVRPVLVQRKMQTLTAGKRQRTVSRRLAIFVNPYPTEVCAEQSLHAVANRAWQVAVRRCRLGRRGRFVSHHPPSSLGLDQGLSPWRADSQTIRAPVAWRFAVGFDAYTRDPADTRI
jgi:hypothetical protein